jgi:hypothetical protein
MYEKSYYLALFPGLERLKLPLAHMQGTGGRVIECNLGLAFYELSILMAVPLVSREQSFVAARATV